MTFALSLLAAAAVSGLPLRRGGPKAICLDSNPPTLYNELRIEGRQDEMQDGAERRPEQHWQHLTEEFQGESDRAAVLVAAALLDLNLEDLLKAFLISEDREVERLLGTSLATMGNRMRMCYCLGLVSYNELRDLRIIKEVRNYFAHNLYVSFDDPRVKKDCAQFRLIRRIMPHAERLPHRRALEQTACMLSVLLVRRTGDIAANKLQRRPEIRQVDLNGQCPLVLDQDQIG